MRRFCLLLCLVLLTGMVSGCRGEDAVAAEVFAVRINEIAVDGEYGDFVELHNGSDQDVSLAGCYFTNDPDEPGKWQFPDVTVPADGYLVLYADGNTAADDGRVHLPFRLTAEKTVVQFSAHSGAVIQQVPIPSSRQGVSYGYHGTDYGWYAVASPAADNAQGLRLGDSRTAESYGIRLNEYLSKNKTQGYDEQGEYSDWLELYNFSDAAVDLSGYTLTDSMKNTKKWVFPTGTVIGSGEYLVVRCSGLDTVTTNGELHTNFKLGDDNFLGLFTAEGTLCIGFAYRETPQDVSLAFFDEQGYIFTTYPTPGYGNVEVTA